MKSTYKMINKSINSEYFEISVLLWGKNIMEENLAKRTVIIACGAILM
jgi:hypothetical protein